MNTYTVKRLPSGYWSVWFGSDWINAALPSQEAAEALAKTLEEGDHK